MEEQVISKMAQREENAAEVLDWDVEQMDLEQC